MLTISIKALDVEYLTVAECLRRNGYRHYLNGMKYLEQGMTQHARGSFAKAQRNYDRALIMHIHPWHNRSDEFANRIAESILNG